MMRLKVETVTEGLHPSEAVVVVKTSTGSERIVVSSRSIDRNSIPVGWPLGTSDADKLTLVELPRETETGAWRVWVPTDHLFNSEERMRA